jgi:hypothetical protein
MAPRAAAAALEYWIGDAVYQHGRATSDQKNKVGRLGLLTLSTFRAIGH